MRAEDVAQWKSLPTIGSISSTKKKALTEEIAFYTLKPLKLTLNFFTLSKISYSALSFTDNMK
jgi:hypothetical protein